MDEKFKGNTVGDSISYASFFDHTILKPEATEIDIINLCNEAKEYKFASVCVNPYWARLAKEKLNNSNVKLCVVIGFPLGMNTTETKVNETEEAIRNGADEVDMVINIGAIKSKKYDDVKRDISAVVNTASKASKETTLVKVILETCLLTHEEKVEACKIAKEAGAHFVKTSTGFSKSGATVEDVRLMREIVGPNFGVKASGGIRTKEDFEKMIKAGANRIGASASVEIMKGCLRETGNSY